jgi:hypothetical protein
MGQRDKPKDAYDIDYLLAHIGIDEIATQIAGFEGVAPVEKALAVLANKFSSVGVIGATSVALYRRLPIGGVEADQIQAFAIVLGRIGRQDAQGPR